MAKSDVSNFFTNAKAVVAKHSPEILTGIGIAGMITTTVLAVQATPKALKKIEEFKEQNNATDKKLHPIDTIKICWKYYIPATVTGALSTACLIGASKVHLKRNAALATAYKLSETALHEYRDAVVETIGEKKEEKLKNTIAKKQMAEHPVEHHDVIVTGKGDTLCYDSMFGRYFKSDRDAIIRIVNDLNRQMRDDMYISLNEFYYEVGLEEVACGYDIGWNITKGYIDPEFSSQLASDGTPCLVIGFSIPPTYDFRNY